MTKYELREYRNITREIKQINEERERLYALAQRCVRAPSSIPGVHGMHDPLPDIMDKLTDLDQQLNPLMDRLLTERSRIEKALNELLGRERHIMRSYYIEGLSWTEVAKRSGYSIAQIFRIHRKSLNFLKYDSP